MKETVVASSALICAIVALRYLLRGKISLRFQYALWALVAVRLVLPFPLLPSPVSILNALEPAPAAAAVQPPDTGGAADTDTVYANIDSHGNDLSPVLPGGTVPSYAPGSGGLPAPAQRGGVSLETALTIVWLGGAVVAACVLAAVNLRFRRALKRAASPSGFAADGVPVYLAGGLPSPCLSGIFRPKIYMTPESFSDPERRRFILAHETTHYKHKDHLWVCVRCLCLILHWFNPLVWLAAALSRRDSELACDEGALLRLGEDSRIGYGRMLVGMMAQGPRPAELLRGATTMTSGKRGVRERIRLIARKPRRLIPALVVAVLLTAAAVGCTFTGADTDAAESANPDAGGQASAVPSGSAGGPSPSAAASPGNDGGGAVEETLFSYVAGGGTVEELANNYIAYVSEHFQEDAPEGYEVSIVESKLTGLERIARFENMTDGPVELWQLAYRLKPDDLSKVMFAGGMSEEDGWITETGSPGSPVLIVGFQGEKPVYMGNTWTLSLMEEGGAENALRIYLERTGLLPPETYPGSHFTARFAMSNGEVYRLILSQPVRQGEGGIWCVERCLYPGGGVSLISPNPDGEAMDTYEQLQADSDTGHTVYLLDPAQAALEYINGFLGQGLTADDLELTEGMDICRSTDLEESLSFAVIENNRSVNGGIFKTEDHELLKTAVDGDTTTVWCIACYAEYNFEAGDAVPVRSSHEPVMVTFMKDSGGAYQLTSYTDPTVFSEDYAEKWLQERFPGDIPDGALDPGQYPQQEEACLQRAEAYFAAQGY